MKKKKMYPLEKKYPDKSRYSAILDNAEAFIKAGQFDPRPIKSEWDEGKGIESTLDLIEKYGTSEERDRARALLLNIATRQGEAEEKRSAARESMKKRRIMTATNFGEHKADDFVKH